MLLGLLYGIALGLVLKDALEYVARHYGDRLHRLRIITNNKEHEIQ